MPNFNKVILAGNLTRDVELRYTERGIAIGNCSLAINRTWTSDNGEKKEEVCFVEFSVFGKTAEAMAQYTAKGHPLLVEGRLKLDQWQDRQSHEDKQKLKVIVETFQFLKSKSDSEHDNGQRQGSNQRSQQRSGTRQSSQREQHHEAEPQGHDNYVPPEEDDVPF